MFALWLRRAAAYFLRIVLPTSLMSQLIGTLLFGRSSPGGTVVMNPSATAGFVVDDGCHTVSILCRWRVDNLGAV